jgi:hypothetical protein
MRIFLHLFEILKGPTGTFLLCSILRHICKKGSKTKSKIFIVPCLLMANIKATAQCTLMHSGNKYTKFYYIKKDREGSLLYILRVIDIEGPLSKLHFRSSRESSLRRKSAALQQFDIVCLYRLPIPLTFK